MGKRYNKSESRKNQPYNKSRRRRPHPPYDESKSRDRAEAAQALEMERDNALDFDLKVPEVDWKLPTIPEIDPGNLVDIPKVKTDTTIAPSDQTEAPKSKPDNYRENPQINDIFEVPEFEVKPKQTKPQAKIAPKTKAPQSLGQKPKPLTREQQIQREMQRRQAAQQQQGSQMKRNTEVHPAAIVGPVIVMFIVMAFLSTIPGIPSLVYLVVLFFFGRHVWNILQGGGQK